MTPDLVTFRALRSGDLTCGDVPLGPALSRGCRPLLLYYGKGANFLMWDLKEATPQARVLISHVWPSPPRASDVSPDGRWLAITFDVEPNGVDLWDLRADDPAARHSVLPGHKNTVRTLIFSPNSR